MPTQFYIPGLEPKPLSFPFTPEPSRPRPACFGHALRGRDWRVLVNKSISQTPLSSNSLSAAEEFDILSRLSPSHSLTKNRIKCPFPKVGNVSHLLLYRQSVVVKRDIDHMNVEKEKSPRGEIDSFSRKSRSRLAFVCSNSVPALTSQFVLTYGKQYPLSGIESKRHLNLFLTKVRKEFQDVKYLWVLEFQRRGVPHYHFFSNLGVDPLTRNLLARLWVDSICGGDDEYRFHSHQKNLIPWDLGLGGYACKYLEKTEQKHVPAGYESCGRFWGCSRKLVPPPDLEHMNHLNTIIPHGVDTITGEVVQSNITNYIVRAMRKYTEKKSLLSGRPLRSPLSNSLLSSVVVMDGRKIYDKVVKYFSRSISNGNQLC